MTTGKLYGNKNNFRTQKVLIAAKLGKSDVQLAGDAAPSDKFPLGVTPAYEGEVLLFGAESIALHVSGAEGKNLAEIVQWLQWAEGSLLPNVLGYVLPSVSAANLCKKVVDSYKAELFAQLTIFNDILLSKTFLVGERLSLADVSVALDLLPAFQYVLDAGAQKKLANVTRWFKTIVNQPLVKEILGDVQLCSSVSEFSEAKHAELAAKLANSIPKKDDGKKKKEAKPAAPKPAPDADEEEDDVPRQAPAADPFAALPKGSFNYDGFKKVYSNEELSVSLPYFWSNFDSDANSIWKCEYRYPTELALTFMSANLIGGMFQRLEKLNKAAFGSMCIFGSDNDSTISGVWFWRGQELAFPLSPDWQIDYESYTWTKLDAKAESTKKIVNEYLSWEGDFDGKKFNQGKIFK
jgi:elongation factor 1-gamma